jgi:hypothetical protein
LEAYPRASDSDIRRGEGSVISRERAAYTLV